MGQIAIAIGIMSGLGLFFGAALAVAYYFLRVEEDPRIDEAEALLPGNNCGACGQPGCRAFAEKLVAGEIAPGRCTVASAGVLEELAAALGVDVGAGDKRVARLRCGGEEGLVGRLARYEGMTSCRAAVLVAGGGRACPWGCVGLADCERACTFGAITMTPAGLPRVEPGLCSACNDCVDVCPLDLFALQPLAQRIVVQCASPLVGDEATRRCSVACDACGLCAKASGGAIAMRDGLPWLTHDASEIGPEVTWKCPTGAIRWVPAAQFERPRRDDLLTLGGDHG